MSHAKVVRHHPRSFIFLLIFLVYSGESEGADWHQGVGHGTVAAQPMGSRVGQADDAGRAATAGQETLSPRMLPRNSPLVSLPARTDELSLKQNKNMIANLKYCTMYVHMVASCERCVYFLMHDTAASAKARVGKNQ